jgi:hypothetical protein
MSAGANRRAIADVALYVAKVGGDHHAVIAEMLDGFFADEWAISKRWPWKALAKDPGRYRRPAPVLELVKKPAPLAPEDPLVAEQRALVTELEYAVAQPAKARRVVEIRERLDEIGRLRRQNGASR